MLLSEGCYLMGCYLRDTLQCKLYQASRGKGVQELCTLIKPTWLKNALIEQSVCHSSIKSIFCVLFLPSLWLIDLINS